jgi:hypothetical protein
MQEFEQNPQPNPPIATQDIHWGITYLHQYMQDLRQDVRKLGDRIDAQNTYFSERFDNFGDRFDAQNKHSNERFEQVIHRQDSHFRWLMGTMITLFVSLGGVILGGVKL